MSLFGLRRKVVADEIEEVRQEIKAIRVAKKKVETELEELKLKKRLEGEEIRHMTKINEERLKSELDTERIKLQKTFQEDISKFKEEQRVELVSSLKEFHNRIEKRSDDEVNRIKDMYQSIMGIMPKVNLMLEKKVR